METKELLPFLQKLDEEPKKRNFNQRIECIINFKDLDLKKPDNQVDAFITLPNYPAKTKRKKVCALVAGDLKDKSEGVFDKIILDADFKGYQADKKKIKKLSEEYDVFVAQATLMPKVAQVFGRVFGPRQKMPNPKGGQVLTPASDVKAVYENAQKNVRVQVKKTPMFQVAVGSEDQEKEEVAASLAHLYNALVRVLPREESNIKNIYLKKTMGKPVKIEWKRGK